MSATFHNWAAGQESGAPGSDTSQPVAEADATTWEIGKWYKLFDGKSLKGWKPTQFGGEGEVTVDAGKGEMTIAMGASMSGVTYAAERPLPLDNYEIRLEAKRIKGRDFFCGLTVPYKDTHFSLIVGGWGGGVVGISSIDGLDASENETTSYLPFTDDTWYKIRLRVHEGRIQAWIDEKNFVDVEIGDRKLTTRLEVDLSKPLGFSTWETSAVLRNIELRRLPVSAK